MVGLSRTRYPVSIAIAIKLCITFVIMKTLAERLTWARTNARLTQQELAKLTGVAQSTIASWESGARETGRKIPVIAAHLGVDPLWLAEGTGSPKPAEADPFAHAAQLVPGAKRIVLLDEDSDEQYRIPKVKLHLQAGITGFQTEPDRRDGGTMGVPKSWADRRGYNPNYLISITVRGESMEPTFYEDDVVVINLLDKNPVDNGVFAVNYDGEAVVKRLSKDAGMWWLMSDNPDQRKYYRRSCEGQGCIIIGKIVRREGEQF
jgi:phage repressor protein C with HTH and peptisase S24 domain